MRGLYLFAGLLALTFSLRAQTFTSVTGGPWNDPATWGGTVPTSANSTLVQIASTHAVTIPAGYSATAVSVTLAPVGASTCSLTIASTGSLSFSGTLTLGSGLPTRGKTTVNGTLVVENGATISGGVATVGRLTIGSTGTYKHNYTTTSGQIYSAAWNTGSTLEIAGYTDFSPSAFSPPSGLNQTFSNFKWNCTGQAMDMYLGAAAASTLTTVNGNFNVAATNGFAFGLATNSNVTLTIGGSLTVGLNSFFDLTGGPGTGNGIVNLAGDFILSADDGVGNFGAGTATLNFNGASAQAFNSPYSVSTAVDFVVLTGARLNVAETSFIQTAGGFTLQSGATLGVASPDGLVIGQTTGNIRTFGARNYAAGGNIIYNGTSAQNLGSEWGSTGALNGFAVNLEIANTSTGGVTNDIIGSTSLVGRLRLTQGALNIGNSNTLIISGDFDGVVAASAGPPVVTARTGTISGHSSGTSNLTFSGSGTIDGTLNFTTGSSTLRNFTIDRAGDLTVGTALTIATAGTLAFPSTGNLRIDGQTLTINGNITQVGSGAIASNSNTSNITIGGSGALTALPLCTSCAFTNSFNNITLSRTGGASYNWGSSANIYGLLDLTSGAFTHSSGLTMATGSTLRRGAGTTYSGSTPNATTTYSVAYVGTVSTTNELPGTALNRLENLTIAGNVTLDKPITINGNLNINSGTFTAGTNDISMLGATFAVNGGSFSVASTSTVAFSRVGTTTLSGSTINDSQFGNLTIATGTTVVAPNANIGVSGLWNNTGSFTPGTGTVTFNGGAQNIDAGGQPFFNVATSGGVKTLVSALDVNGGLTIGAGSTLSPTSLQINVAGTWSNLGTFIPGTGTVVFDGAAQSLNSAGQAFNNIAFTGSGNKTLASAIDVNGSITITGVTLDVSGSNFGINLAGHWTNNGTFNPRVGTVTLDGSTIQTIAGTTNTNFYNITQTNPSTVTIGSTQSLVNTLTLSGGTFNPNGNFVMLSSAAGDARIAEITGGATISATSMTIQRYLPNTNSSQSYRYLASPVKNATVSQWMDDFPVTGTFNDPSQVNPLWTQFPNMVTNSPSFYYYNEAKTPTTSQADRYQSYPLNGTSSTSAQLDNGRGYAAFVRQNSALTSMEVVGQAQSGPVPVTLSNQAGTVNDGWNLIGNPYPAPISWDKVSVPLSVVSAQIAFKDNTNNIGLGAGQYVYYTQGTPGVGIPASYNGTIAQGQAFWVRRTVAGTNTDITFQEDDKQATFTPPFMREGEIPDLLRIHVAGNSRADELLIRFEPAALDIAENNFDAYKLKNDYINFASLSSDGQEMAINTFGALACSREISLVLNNVAAGQHAFTFNGVESFSSNVDVRLLDTFTGQTFTVKPDNNIYNFQVTANASSFGKNRFKIFVGYHDIDLGVAAVTQDICSGTDANITLQAPQAGVTYYAELNGTTISDQFTATAGSNLTISIPKTNLTGVENKVVLMAKLAGCAQLPLTNSVTINVKNIPTIEKVTGGNQCGEGAVTLQATGAPSGGSYRWYLTEDATAPIDGATSSSFITPSLTKTKTFFVSAVNSLGCEGGRMAVKAQISYPYDVAGVTGATSCSGGTASLSAVGAPADGSYRWYATQSGLESIPNQSSSTFVTPALTSTTTYYVAIVNAAGCEGARVPVTASIASTIKAEISVEGDKLTSNFDTGNQWYLNNTAIPGATGKTYQPKESGIYKLVVTAGPCSSSVEREYAVTGIESEDIKGYMMYPNPSSGMVYVEVATAEPVTVSVRNQLGSEIVGGELKQEGNARKGQFDISGHASGLYLLVIKHGEKTVIRKLIKN